MKQIIFLAFIIIAVNIYAENHLNSKDEISRFLLLSNPDNIKTKHYPLVMVAEALNVPADSASHKINNVIFENMMEVASVFTTYSPAKSDIKLDMKTVSKDEYKKLLNRTGADFIVLLDEYELIWKEDPFPTLFHNIKYSIYNEEKILVKEGNGFYSTYDLVDEKELKKASRKCSRKIADNILKYSLN